MSVRENERENGARARQPPAVLHWADEHAQPVVPQVEATKFTEVGYVGRDVEQLLEEIKPLLPETEFHDHLMATLKPRHPDEALGDMQARLMFEVFGRHGLLAIEPRDLPDSAFEPLTKWWSKSDEIRDKVTQTCDDLTDLGIDITLDELTTEWRLMADLYALAIQCDRVRFGSLTFLAAGERIRLTGDYMFNGKKRFEFDDANQLRASGSAGCSHEWWHRFNPQKDNKQLRMHAHMKMREVAYFLQRLNEDETREANGKTLLENALITVSTESGDGRHNDVKRELSGVFHAVSGANGRFKTGEIVDVKSEGIDVYNTMLGAMDAKRHIGPADREKRPVDSIRA